MNSINRPRTPASPGRDFRASYLLSLGFNKDKVESLLESKVIGVLLFSLCTIMIYKRRYGAIEKLDSYPQSSTIPKAHSMEAFSRYAYVKMFALNLLMKIGILPPYKEVWSFVDMQHNDMFKDMSQAAYLLKHKQPLEWYDVCSFFFR